MCRTACRFLLFALIAAAAVAGRPALADSESDAALRTWLGNMVSHHGYDVEEAAAATRLTPAEVESALTRWKIPRGTAPPDPAAEGVIPVLPYPGGRHPRLGFLDGAIDPERGTKLSIFPPWADGGYVVLDVPEAVWSDRGLIFLAHTHLPTVWGARLPARDWERRPDGSFRNRRELPDRTSITVEATPERGRLAVRLTIRNGSPDLLTNLRVQVCALLGRARGFESPAGGERILDAPFAAARAADTNRWVITAWQPLDRVWENPPCPCIHADPRLPDCPPGESRTATGYLSFYQGDDIRAELDRLRIAWFPPAAPLPAR